ncbi:hypothetical protein DALLNEIH_03681 [Bacillus sp. B01(2024)]
MADIMTEFLKNYYIYIQIVGILVLVASAYLLKTSPTVFYKRLYTLFTLLLVVLNILVYCIGNGIISR